MKSGTTSLHYYLKQHPQVYMSKKETNFFSSIDSRRGYSDDEIETYSKLFFSGVLNEVAIGEVSHSYLFFSNAARYIKYYLPNVKLIAIIRQPIDRAYSHFLHWKRLGLLPLNADFVQVLREEQYNIINGKMNSKKPIYFYIEKGRYYFQLLRYFENFDHKKIKIYLYEDFFNKENLVSNIQDLFYFLEVENFTPTFKKYNTAKSFSCGKLSLNKFKPKQLSLYLRKSLLNFNLLNINNNITSDLRKQLTDEFYKNDILKLQELIQQDLSIWLTN